LFFYGYNHRSLLGDPGNRTDENYWLKTETGETDSGTQRTMRSSVKAARERWIQDGLGPLPTTYVAPNNKIDGTGLLALRDAFPEIRIFASDITIPFKKGGRLDYGEDPVNPHFFALPRWTSGYLNTDSVRLKAVSQLAHFGVWSHFIHPDDLFDPGRNPEGRTWREMYAELTDLLAWSRANYPWLEWVSTIRAAGRIEGAMESRVSWEYSSSEQELTATFTGPPARLWVRLSGDKIIDTEKLSGASLLFSHEDRARGSALYVLACSAAAVRIPCKSYP
jgi:hypothetical protein